MRPYEVECTVDGIRTIIEVHAFSQIDARTVVEKMFKGCSVTIYWVR